MLWIAHSMLSKTCLLFGGGLDSWAVALHLLKATAINDLCLYHIDYGQVAHKAERKSMEAFSQLFGVSYKSSYDTTISNFNPQPNLLFGTGVEPHVNMRNLGLILKAAQDFNDIYLGITEGAFADTSQQFLDTVNNLLSNSIYTRTVTVHAPLIGIGKEEACRQALQHEPKLFELAMTCWTPFLDKECGICKHCLEKYAIKNKLLRVAA